MIGLVNAAGATDALHRDVAKKTNESTDRGLPERTPVLSNEQAANRVLRTAVESIRMHTQESQRGAPGDGESDRFHQADLESSVAQGPLGRSLDVTA